MNRDFAERILSNVLNWDMETVVENRKWLDNFADLKYDEYQQYETGSRFIENLSNWLFHFETLEEREIALRFIREHLVFISQEEMHHLIDMVYPDKVRPILKKQMLELISQTGLDYTKEARKKIVSILGRQSLFLGLSEGARLDVFRRSAPDLSNEQISVTYDLSEEKLKTIYEDMEADTENFYVEHPELGIRLEKGQIKNIFLMDDFSGSGVSYLRKKEDGKTWTGKIAKVLDLLRKRNVNVDNISFYLILYLATDKAINNIQNSLKEYAENNIKVEVLQKIHPYEPEEDFKKLIEKYFNKNILTSHYKKGKHDQPWYGFDECSLPLVIYHNTPNNSFPLIWDDMGVFPRVSRHKDVI